MTEAIWDKIVEGKCPYKEHPCSWRYCHRHTPCGEYKRVFNTNYRDFALNPENKYKED